MLYSYPDPPAGTLTTTVPVAIVQVGCTVTEAVGATGGPLTVTTALPDVVPGQLFASDAAVKVYVVVIDGLTVNVKGEARILLTVTGVVPSV